ncbi:MAG: hypothetical protein E3J72_06930 [Planctomycetota bacterium]|nr:MAG: hypothetical protein E3J72_06930 [Planctomycetota bacterium]
MARKILDKVSMGLSWDSFSGALTDILNYLGGGFEPYEVPGRSAYAFRITMHEIACPSGPQMTAWPVLFPPALTRCGFNGEFFHGWPNEPGFERKKNDAIAALRDSIDRDIPALLYAPGDVLKFGLVIGSDDGMQKFIASAHTEPGKIDQIEIPYKEIGTNKLGLMSVLVVGGKNPDFDNEAAVRESFKAAWEHLEGRDWVHSDGKYANGIAAYDLWIKAMRGKRDDIDQFGLAYCAHYYAEARAHALEYVKAYSGVLGDDDAGRKLVEDYTASSRALAEIAEMLPFPEGAFISDERAAAMINHLRVAKEKEINAHAVLGEIFSG